MKTIPKLVEQDGVYFITVESDIFLDEKSIKVKVFNCPKNGDKWFLNLIIEPSLPQELSEKQDK